MYEHDAETPEFHYFNSIPWCARHMRGSNLIVRPPSCRTVEPSGENLLFGRTLNTARAIPAMLEIFSTNRRRDHHHNHDNPDDKEDDNKNKNKNNGNGGSSNHDDLINEVKCLVALGPDVNGYPATLHGGIVAAILDEAVAMLIPINREQGLLPREGDHFTAYLHTQYRRPVPTTAPALLARARLVRVDAGRRKFFGEATLEDEGGTVLASAEALFVRVQEKL